MCSLALFAFQKIKGADIPFIFFDKVPEEKNYNQVYINDAAVKSLNTLKINIPEAVSVLALSDGFLPKIYTPEISYIETSGYKLGKLAFAKMINCFNGLNENMEDFTKKVLVKGGSL